MKLLKGFTLGESYEARVLRIALTAGLGCAAHWTVYHATELKLVPPDYKPAEDTVLSKTSSGDANEIGFTIPNEPGFMYFMVYVVETAQTLVFERDDDCYKYIGSFAQDEHGRFFDFEGNILQEIG